MGEEYHYHGPEIGDVVAVHSIPGVEGAQGSKYNKDNMPLAGTVTAIDKGGTVLSIRFGCRQEGGTFYVLLADCVLLSRGNDSSP